MQEDRKVMKAVTVAEPGNVASAVARSVQVPQPKSGQVLIRVAFSPIHPADLSYIKNIYQVKSHENCIPGLEGSGTVIASGGGMLPWVLLGKRVAFISLSAGGWSEYVIVNAKNCLVLPENVSLEQGSMYFANPFTCCMFMELIKAKGHKAVIQSGAASACGKMMMRYCKAEGVQVVNVVYRREQVEMMRSYGAEHVLCSADADFFTSLQSISEQLRPSIAFDCVSGALTGQILSCLQPASTLYLYGFLSMKPVLDVSAADLLFQGKRIEGLIFGKWIQQQGIAMRLKFAMTVSRLFASVFYTDVRRTFPLDQVQEAIDCFRSHRSEGKVLFAV